jgi:hypothetical protein
MRLKEWWGRRLACRFDDGQDETVPKLLDEEGKIGLRAVTATIAPFQFMELRTGGNAGLPLAAVGGNLPLLHPFNLLSTATLQIAIAYTALSC